MFQPSPDSAGRPRNVTPNNSAGRQPDSAAMDAQQPADLYAQLKANEECRRILAEENQRLKRAVESQLLQGELKALIDEVQPAAGSQAALANNKNTLPPVIEASSDTPAQSPPKGAGQGGTGPGCFGMLPVVHEISNFITDFKGTAQSASNQPPSRLTRFVNCVGDIARLTIGGGGLFGGFYLGYSLVGMTSSTPSPWVSVAVGSFIGLLGYYRLAAPWAELAHRIIALGVTGAFESSAYGIEIKDRPPERIAHSKRKRSDPYQSDYLNPDIFYDQRNPLSPFYRRPSDPWDSGLSSNSNLGGSSTFDSGGSSDSNSAGYSTWDNSGGSSNSDTGGSSTWNSGGSSNWDNNDPWNPQR